MCKQFFSIFDIQDHVFLHVRRKKLKEPRNSAGEAELHYGLCYILHYTVMMAANHWKAL